LSSNETTLLEKELKYNLHTKKKNWLVNLALEAETAIAQLPVTDREFYRKQVADCIETLHLQNNSNLKPNTHSETRMIKSIQTKPKNNNTMVTVADRGNSIVILPIQQYKTNFEVRHPHCVNQITEYSRHTVTTQLY
jgi:hypothetical protein